MPRRIFFVAGLIGWLLACQEKTTERPAEVVRPPLFRVASTLQLPAQPLGLAVADMNNDGFPEIIALHQKGISYWTNNRQLTFQQAFGIPEGLQSFALTLADLDGDGYLDIFAPPYLLHNRRDHTFGPNTDIQGLPSDACTVPFGFFDLDKDGDLDFQSGSRTWQRHHNQFREQDLPRLSLSPYLYLDATLNGSGDALAIKNKQVTSDSYRFLGDNLAFLVAADLDRDGDPDLVALDADGKLHIHQNRAREQYPQHHYLRLRLIGSPSNYHSIGARVRIGTQTYENLPQTPFGMQPPLLHLGLGTSQSIEQIQVQWPDGRSLVLENIRANQDLTLHQNHAQ